MPDPLQDWFSVNLNSLIQGKATISIGVPIDQIIMNTCDECGWTGTPDQIVGSNENNRGACPVCEGETFIIARK